jgi:hypothetical protein
MNGKSQAHIPPSSLDRSKSSKSLVEEVVHCVISWHIIDMSLEWHFGWHKLSKSSLYMTTL